MCGTAMGYLTSCCWCRLLCLCSKFARSMPGENNGFVILVIAIFTIMEALRSLMVVSDNGQLKTNNLVIKGEDIR